MPHAVCAVKITTMNATTRGTVRLVRHAMLQLELGGRRLLVDPMLDPAQARPAVANTANERRNPLVELPEPAAQVAGWPQAVLISHLHADHFDATAAELLGDRLPVFCQPEDTATLLQRGLAQAEPVEVSISWEGLAIARTGGRHGTGELADLLAPVSGFVIDDGALKVYVAGDTVWCDEVAAALAAHRPDVVIVNAGGARFVEGDPITMTATDVLEVRAAAPEARIIAVHLEAINHCLEDRAALARGTAEARVAIPADGETIAL
jgi:L-ascorbate metabolism protein UlaG (beta-lactamase superfamily)